MNVADLFKKIDEQKPLGKKVSRWPWANRNKFTAGRYRIRFLANDEKCPQGFHIYTVHEVQKEATGSRWSMTMKEREESYFRILCTESYKGYTDSGKLAAPCPVCDVVHDISNEYSDDDMIDRDLLNCVDEMSSNECRKFLYPILVGASEADQTNDKGESKKVYVPDDRAMMGAVLALNAKNYEGNADLSLIKLIHAHVLEEEENLSSRKGRWFTWEKKQNGQSLTPAERGELNSKELEIASKMPNVIGFGASQEQGPFSKNYKVGYDRGLSMLKQCWAIKALIQFHDYDLDSLKRGQV